MEDDIAPPAPTDPRLPLNAMQVFKLKKSWKGIKRSLEDTGTEMFIRLFRNNPGTQDLFPTLKGKTSDELRVSEEMENVSGAMMGVLDECVQNIDKVDDTLAVLARTAQAHKKRPGFKASMFLELERPALEALQITLGDRYTDNMDAIYKITIHYLLDTLSKKCGS